MASDPTPSLAQKVQSSYLRLSKIAFDLNAVSDELGKSVAEIDLALKRLNLGVSVWVDIRRGTSDDGLSYWGEDLGYSKINKTFEEIFPTFYSNPRICRYCERPLLARRMQQEGRCTGGR